ncbi:ATP-binding cassette sub-family C member 9 [Eumeta japonica]|uniref:ATP-binding cassette sub-family C member 9 n=1 Tax=Eumeta variegata TaxID=151549 RepID=A0A4C1Z293_EUMVA|nr:ATP-binding cassette sub-family C member 9 [Eumeta japonica]
MEKEDLGLLPENERSAGHCEKFEKLYIKSMVRKFYLQFVPATTCDFCTTMLIILKRLIDLSQEQNNAKGCRMLRCYAAMVWPNFYLGGLLKLLGDAMSLVPPFGLAVVVRHVQEPAVSDFDAHTPVTIGEFFNNGYAIVLIVTLCTICQSILSQSSTHLVTVEGIRLKTSLQARNSSRIALKHSQNKEEHAPLIATPPDARNPAGLLTNLVSHDTYNVMSCTWICHYIWTVPLKVILILYLLYSKLGPSAILGSATSMLLIIPIQFYIGKKISVNSKEISAKSDHRISKMTEILQGINVIKLYVWEDIFKEKILNLREVELNLLKKDSIYWSFLRDSEHLTAANVFASLALFNQLSIPLLVLPVTVLMVIQAKISTTRISDFLMLPESGNAKEDSHSHCPYEVQQTKGVGQRVNNDDSILQSVTESSDSEIEDSDIEEHFEDYPNNINDENNKKVLVQYKDAQFSWTSKDISSLEIDELQIPAGQLIMVVGTTGSGKSSLLSAAIGEMRLERGDVSWTRPTSKWYAGQPPWLLEDSVRDNIVMGGAWNPRRYARVLRTTGLHSDLQLLPGARGAPLSGGQRVRVCLARALYGRARLLALDEPLGSLDAALARHVVVRGLVPAARAGRTILLATNRLELLHYANMVIVIENGRVSCKGRVGRNATGVLSQWWRMGDEARAAAARNGVGPPGGTTQERDTLIRTLSRAKLRSFVGETSRMRSDGGGSASAGGSTGAREQRLAPAAPSDTTAQPASSSVIAARSQSWPL